MKKLIIAILTIFTTITFSACTKENVKPVAKATVLADKGNLSQADLIGDPSNPATSDKGNLSQADGESGSH